MYRVVPALYLDPEIRPSNLGSTSGIIFYICTPERSFGRKPSRKKFLWRHHVSNVLMILLNLFKTHSSPDFEIVRNRRIPDVDRQDWSMSSQVCSEQRWVLPIRYWWITISPGGDNPQRMLITDKHGSTVRIRTSNMCEVHLRSLSTPIMNLQAQST